MATAEFSKFAGILSEALSQHYLSGFEIAQLEFHPLTRFIYINISQYQYTFVLFVEKNPER